jgi:RNA polymerase sigma-70 factor (ECF subfamily)
MREEAARPRGADTIERARAGDRAALGALLAAAEPMLLRQARVELDRRLRGRLGASDLVQSALLEAARDFRGFNGSTVGQLRAWLRGILRSTVLDVRKAQRGAQKRDVAREQPSDGGGLRELAAPLTSPSQHIARRELMQRIERASAALPASQREALAGWAAGHPIREIAARTGRTELAVASLLKRAFEALRMRVTDDGSNPAR